MKNIFRLLAVVVLVASACAKESAQQPQTRATTPDATVPAPAQETVEPARQQGEVFQLADGTTARFYGEADVRGKERFKIEMGSAGSDAYYFSPTVLIGSPGQKLILDIFNGDKQGHPFLISSQNVEVPEVAPGKTETVTVTFPASGAVTFSCPHEAHAGELRVG